MADVVLLCKQRIHNIPVTMCLSSLQHLHSWFYSASTLTPSIPLTCMLSLPLPALTASLPPHISLSLLLPPPPWFPYLIHPKICSVVCVSSILIWMLVTRSSIVFITQADIYTCRTRCSAVQRGSNCSELLMTGNMIWYFSGSFTLFMYILASHFRFILLW